MGKQGSELSGGMIALIVISIIVLLVLVGALAAFIQRQIDTTSKCAPVKESAEVVVRSAAGSADEDDSATDSSMAAQTTVSEMPVAEVSNANGTAYQRDFVGTNVTQDRAPANLLVQSVTATNDAYLAPAEINASDYQATADAYTRDLMTRAQETSCVGADAASKAAAVSAAAAVKGTTTTPQRFAQNNQLSLATSPAVSAEQLAAYQTATRLGEDASAVVLKTPGDMLVDLDTKPLGDTNKFAGTEYSNVASDGAATVG